MSEGRTPGSSGASRARLAQTNGIESDTDDGQRRAAEARRYRLGEIERGQATVFRRDDEGNVERIGYITQLGQPGSGTWWAIAEPPLTGEFYPWNDRMDSTFGTRRDGVSALVSASMHWHLEPQE